jgi:hypothetical protein
MGYKLIIKLSEFDDLDREKESFMSQNNTDNEPNGNSDQVSGQKADV